jgi:hypothetical protein
MSLAQDIAKKVLEFEKSNKRNEWLEIGPFKIYVRNANRFINNSFTQTLDLASFELEEAYRGKGTFKELLKILEKRSQKILYVECVVNPRLKKFMSQRSRWNLINYNCFYYSK